MRTLALLLVTTFAISSAQAEEPESFVRDAKTPDEYVLSHLETHETRWKGTDVSRQPCKAMQP